MRLVALLLAAALPLFTSSGASPLLPPATGPLWAVLCAGSKGWGNYRHQANVYHAYQVLISRGVPAANIITFAYDDIANNVLNPTKGIVVNKPGGPDVYAGVVLDYTRGSVTPHNFLSVLRAGNIQCATGPLEKGACSKRVLGGGRSSRVFLFFSDHGDGGILAFPSDTLSAADLMPAVRASQAGGLFSEIVIYTEACDSGSMFDNLLMPNETGIYAVTSTTAFELGYACDYDGGRYSYVHLYCY
jgi:legumain